MHCPKCGGKKCLPLKKRGGEVEQSYRCKKCGEEFKDAGKDKNRQ